MHIMSHLAIIQRVTPWINGCADLGQRRIKLLESPIPAPDPPPPSQKASSDDISGTKRGTIDPLVSKRPEKVLNKKIQNSKKNVKNGQTWSKWSKWSKMVKMVPNGPKWWKIVKNCQNCQLLVYIYKSINLFHQIPRIAMAISREPSKLS